MTNVGRVKELWRFPVKSMAGERLDRAVFDAEGLVGDRIWAMRDEVRQEIQWGKKYPQLVRCAARYRSPPRRDAVADVDITFPDGTVAGSDDDRVHARLSELIGRPATLRHRAPDRELYRRYKPTEAHWIADIEEMFAREPGEPLPDLTQFPAELMDFVAFPGAPFFDALPVHVVTTATLAHLRARNPAADWDARRFRANILVETDARHAGLVEQGWLGRRLRIGPLVLQCAAPTPRCSMTTRALADLVEDRSILRTIVKEADQNVGVYAVVVQGGEVAVDADLALMD
jgi:uncharacterized protein YcbX